MSQPAVEPAVASAVEDALRIDDLTFTDLLRTALEEIPASSRGQWTLHGPVDPGITLLERFAWELEQRLYTAEQVTPEMVRASLRLLGAGEPAPTRCARTVLCLRGTDPAVEVAAGTVFRLDGDHLDRRFAISAPVTTVRLGPVRVVGAPLRPGDQVDVIVSDGGVRPGAVRVSLLVVLADVPGIDPAWHPDGGSVQPPVALRWTALGPDGSEVPVSVDDSTGGLRRTGLLGLTWPAVWDALGAGGCRLRATVVDGSFTEPVRIVAVHPNAVPAEDRVPALADLTDQLRDRPALPGGRLRLAGTAGRLLDGSGEVTLDLVEPDGVTRRWHSVGSWTGVGPDDRVFLVERARGELTFGDGRAGRIPRVASGGAATAAYATGGGQTGNLGPDGDWIREDAAGFATNAVPASGGTDAEALEDATQRMADDRSAADRTVTTVDAEQLALATPGVGLQRAHASLGLHPDFPCLHIPSAISVTVVPYADRAGDPATWTPAPMPDTGALGAARSHLGAGRLVGQEVFVLAPVYRRVMVRVTVSQSALSTTLEQRVRTALERHLDPLCGGPDGTGWPFGAPVRPSALIGVVSNELGPESVVTGLSVALDDDEASSCEELPIGERELVAFDRVDVTWVTSVPAGGGLR